MQAPRPRITWRAGVILFAILAMAASVLWLPALLFGGAAPHRPPLTEGLEGKWADIARAFDRRVKDRFPLGSLESEMVAQLRAQGFSNADWAGKVEGEKKAWLEERIFPCLNTAIVYWRADAAGRLIARRGEYPMGSCL